MSRGMAWNATGSDELLGRLSSMRNMNSDAHGVGSGKISIMFLMKKRISISSTRAVTYYDDTSLMRIIQLI